MKKTKAKFAVGQVVDKVFPGDLLLRVSVIVRECKWAGHTYYYRVQYVGGVQETWLLEAQLAHPLGNVI